MVVNNNSAASGAASFPTTGRYRVAVVRNGTNYEFYLNGAQAGTDETGAATAIDWTGTDRGVTLLNRHNGDPGEGRPPPGTPRLVSCPLRCRDQRSEYRPPARAPSILMEQTV